jgi:uncharacterized protein
LLCRRYGVTRLRIFGSALTGDWDEQTSDFDFLVEYGPKKRLLPVLERIVGLQIALEDLLGRKVDVVNWALARNKLFSESAEASSRDLYAA